MKERIALSCARLGQKLRCEITLWDVFICAFMGIAYGIAPDYMATGSATFSAALLVRVLCAFLAFLLAAPAARAAIRYIADRKCGKLDRFFAAKRAVFLYWAIIFVCWLPILCLLYPGSINNDSYSQLNQIMCLKYGVYDLSAHHPLFDTVVMSYILLPLVGATDNWHLGMFIYVLIQALAASFTFSCTVCYAKDKLKLKSGVLLFMLLAYALLPVYPETAQVIGKDCLSSWIYCWFFMYFLELIRTRGTVLATRRNFLGFLAACLLAILSKKVTFYVIVLSLLVYAIFHWKGSKRVFAVIAALLLFQYLCVPVTHYVFGIQESGKQEMFSLPFQQTARYVKEHPDDVTPEEAEILNRVLDYENLAENYDYDNADPIKGYTQRGDDEDYTAYLKVWLAQGLRHPLSYINAACAHIAGWFSLSKYDVLTSMDHHTQLNTFLIPESVTVRSTFCEKLVQIENTYYDVFNAVPVLGILTTYGFYATMLPAFGAGTLLSKKRRGYLSAVVPLLLCVILGCFLAPVSVDKEGQRYLYPAVYSFPLMIAWLAFAMTRTSASAGEECALSAETAADAQ